MKALITGGAGFIGERLAKRLLRMPDALRGTLEDLIMLDIRTAPGLSREPDRVPRVTWAEGDLVAQPKVHCLVPRGLAFHKRCAREGRSVGGSGQQTESLVVTLGQ